jgi:hypothetical protein
MQQQEADDDDDDVQEELATQAHPENSVPEDAGTPEAEVIYDTDLGNTEEEEAAASAMDVEPEIPNEKEEELGDQDAVVVEEKTIERIFNREQIKAMVLPSSILKEPSIAAKNATTSKNIKGWFRARSNQVFNRSQLLATSPEETGPGTIDRGITGITKCAAADAASAADTTAAIAPVTTATAASASASASAAVTAATSPDATTAVTTATTAAVFTSTGPSSVETRKPRHEIVTSSPPTPAAVAAAIAAAIAAASTPSAEKPERRYKKILSAKSVLGGPSLKEAAYRKLSPQSSSPPTTPHPASASKRKLSLRSSPPTVAEVASPTTNSLTAKVRAAAAKRSAEKNKRVAETSPIVPTKKQKTTPDSTEKNKRVAETSPIPTKKQTTTPDSTENKRVAETSPIPTKKQTTTPGSTEKTKRVAETSPAIPTNNQMTTTGSTEKNKRVAETSPIVPAKKQTTTTGSEEMNKRMAETSPIPTNNQKTTTGSKSSAASKGPVTSKSKKRAHPHETFSGPPDEAMEGGWPAGWKKSVVQRQSGATAGTQDRYWYTPTLEYKLRSMKEVKRFMAALATAKGDEKEAWGAFKHKK